MLSVTKGGSGKSSLIDTQSLMELAMSKNLCKMSATHQQPDRDQATPFIKFGIYLLAQSAAVLNSEFDKIRIGVKVSG